MTVEVRPATVADVPAVRAVAEAAWWAACGSFLDAGTVRQVLREWYDPDLLEAAADSEDIHFLVAVDPDAADGPGDGAGVVGFASAELTWADEAELYTCYVHPDRWGEGVGAALVEAVQAWAREEGADYLVCSVFADNPVGPAFFGAVGFERVDRVGTEICGETHPEVVFEKEL